MIERSCCKHARTPWSSHPRTVTAAGGGRQACQLVGRWRQPVGCVAALVHGCRRRASRMVAPGLVPAAQRPMPHKNNANGRHHIPKMRHAVTNWAEYEGGLRRRGSLTLWVTDEAIAAWAATRRASPGGQASYCDSRVQTCLMLRAAFELALRQAEGLMLSVVELLGCELTAPDHMTVGRRAARLESIHPRAAASRAAARLDRQHRIGGVRSRPVADGQARSLEAHMAQAAPRPGRPQRADRGRHIDGSGPQR